MAFKAGRVRAGSRKPRMHVGIRVVDHRPAAIHALIHAGVGQGGQQPTGDDEVPAAQVDLIKLFCGQRVGPSQHAADASGQLLLDRGRGRRDRRERLVRRAQVCRQHRAEGEQVQQVELALDRRAVLAEQRRRFCVAVRGVQACDVLTEHVEVAGKVLQQALEDQDGDVGYADLEQTAAGVEHGLCVAWLGRKAPCRFGKRLGASHVGDRHQ